MRRASPLAAALAVLMTGLTALATGLTAPAAAAAAGPWRINEQSRVRLISPWAAAPPRGEILFGLHFRMAPGWHVYWKNSGDAGFPPALELGPAQVLSGAEILWPAPERYELPGGLVAYGYEDEVVYPVRARRAAGEGAAGAPLTIRGVVDYLVCEVDCIPYRYELALLQPLAERTAAAVPDPVTRPLLDAWLARVPRRPEAVGIEVEAHLARDVTPASENGGLELILTARRAGAGGETGLRLDPESADLFFASDAVFSLGRPAAEAVPAGVRFVVPVAPRDPTAPLPETALFDWTLTGPGPVGGLRGIAGEARLAVPPPAGPAGEAAPPRDRSPRAVGSGILLTALGAGLVLNLTPSLLAGLAAGARPRRPGEGLGLAAGALLALLGTGAAAVALGAPGFQGWGAPLEHPAWTALLALLALLASLELWGEIEPFLAPPAAGRATPAAVARGAVLALLALPWLPPAISGAWAAALGQGWAEGAPVAVALALGLALPWLLLSRRSGTAKPPAGTEKPPTGGGKPPGGGDRRVLRPALGFLSALTLVWIFYRLSRRLPASQLALLQLGLLAVAALAALRHRAPERGRLRAILTLLLVLAAIAVPWLAGGLEWQP